MSNSGFCLRFCFLDCIYLSAVFSLTYRLGRASICAAVSCNSTTDPQPNALTAEVVRTDHGQTGVTTQTAVFTYSCNSGFALVGPPTVTFSCTGTAYTASEWQAVQAPPICSAAVPCNETLDAQPNNLTVEVERRNSGQTSSTGDSALFKYGCSVGFQLDSAANVTFVCTGDTYGTSSWKGSPPTCSASQCNEAADPEPNSLAEGVKRVDFGQTGATNSSETFIYSCIDGYRLAPEFLPDDDSGDDQRLSLSSRTFNCTGDAEGSSTWKGSTPRCIVVSCDERIDTGPNEVGASLSSRIDFGQGGSTGSAAIFSYACPEGFSLQVPEQGWAFSAGSVWFVCTGTGYGRAEWKGTVPACIRDSLVSVDGVDLFESDFAFPSLTDNSPRRRVVFSPTFRERAQQLETADLHQKRNVVRQVIHTLAENGMNDGTLIWTRDLPFPEELRSKLEDVAVFVKQLVVDTELDGIDMDAINGEGRRLGVYFGVANVGDSCTLRHEGEEKTCLVNGMGSFACSVEEGETGRQGKEGDTVKMDTAAREKNFRFISVFGSVTMYIEEISFSELDVSPLPSWLVFVVSSVSIVCMVGPIVGGFLWLRWFRQREETRYCIHPTAPKQKKADLLDDLRKEKRTSVAGGSAVIEDGGGGKEKYVLKIAVDRRGLDEEWSNSAVCPSEEFEEGEAEVEDENLWGRLEPSSAVNWGNRYRFLSRPSHSFHSAKMSGRSLSSEEEEEEEEEEDSLPRRESSACVEDGSVSIQNSSSSSANYHNNRIPRRESSASVEDDSVLIEKENAFVMDGEGDGSSNSDRYEASACVMDEHDELIGGGERSERGEESSDLPAFVHSSEGRGGEDKFDRMSEDDKTPVSQSGGLSVNNIVRGHEGGSSIERSMISRGPSAVSLGGDTHTLPPPSRSPFPSSHSPKILDGQSDLQSPPKKGEQEAYVADERSASLSGT